jgi:hypothetical protein
VTLVALCCFVRNPAVLSHQGIQTGSLSTHIVVCLQAPQGLCEARV